MPTIPNPERFELDAVLAEIDAAVDQAHRAANNATGAAAAARELADRLRHRRSMVAGRLGRCLEQHRADIWTSAAAERSRATLQHEVGFSVWTAVDAIAWVEVALRDEAETLEATARRHRQAADRAEARRATTVVAALAGQDSAS